MWRRPASSCSSLKIAQPTRSKTAATPRHLPSSIANGTDGSVLSRLAVLRMWSIRFGTKIGVLPRALSDLPEACAHLAHECLRLLERREMTTLFEFVEVNQLRVSLLRPSPRGA